MENNTAGHRKIIIGLVGRICSGKGEMSQYMAKKYGAAVLSFSDPMREMLRMLNQDVNRKNIQTFSLAIRKYFGENAFSTMIKGQALKRNENIIVLDPFRRSADIEAFQSDGMVSIGFVRDENSRYISMVNRNREKSDSTISKEEFIKLDNAESETEIDALVAKADYTIENNGTVGELYKKVDDLMAEILKK